MTDYTETAKGTGVFIVGMILSILLTYMIPGITTALNNETVNTYAQLGMILIWIVGVIILPNYFFYRAITTQNDTDQFMNIIISIFMLLFTFLFLYKGNFVITAMANFIEGGFLLSLYWIGIILVIGVGYIITPIATIIQASNKGQ